MTGYCCSGLLWALCASRNLEKSCDRKEEIMESIYSRSTIGTCLRRNVRYGQTILSMFTQNNLHDSAIDPHAVETSSCIESVLTMKGFNE